MPIDNGELPLGTKLVGSHRKATYVCEVVATPDGKTAYQLEDGSLSTSPSSAGKAVMNGVACNGWRFWSVEGTGPAKAEKPAKAKQPNAAKRLSLIKKLRSQKDAPEGHTGWFCSACQKAFNLPDGQEPATCPEGHPWEVEEEFETAS